MDKSQLRKSPDPLVKKFHRFLVYETENVCSFSLDLIHPTYE